MATTDAIVEGFLSTNGEMNQPEQKAIKAAEDAELKSISVNGYTDIEQFDKYNPGASPGNRMRAQNAIYDRQATADTYSASDVASDSAVGFGGTAARIPLDTASAALELSGDPIGSASRGAQFIGQLGAEFVGERESFDAATQDVFSTTEYIADQAKKSIEGSAVVGTVVKGVESARDSLVDALRTASGYVSDTVEELRSDGYEATQQERRIATGEANAKVDAAMPEDANPLDHAKANLQKIFNTASEFGLGETVVQTIETLPYAVTAGLAAKNSAAVAKKKAEAKIESDLRKTDPLKPDTNATISQRKQDVKDVAKAEQKGAGAGATKATAVLEGSANATEIYNTIQDTTFETLANDSPLFNELINEGMSPEDARSEVARKASTGTAVASGVAAGAANVLTGGLAEKAFTVPTSKTVGGSVGRVLASAATETVEEGIQSGTGQAISNIATQQTADETVETGEGVIEAIGEGAVAGGLSSGLTTATAETIPVLAKATGKTVELTGKGVRNLAEVGKAYSGSESDVNPVTEIVAKASEDVRTVDEMIAEVEQEVPLATESVDDVTPTEQDVVKNTIGAFASHVQVLKDSVQTGDAEAVGQAAFDMFHILEQVDQLAVDNPTFNQVKTVLTRDGGYLNEIDKVLRPNAASTETLRGLYQSGNFNADIPTGEIYELATEDKSKVKFLVNQALYSTNLDDSESAFNLNDIEQLNTIVQSTDAVDDTTKAAIAEFTNFKRAEAVYDDVARGAGNAQGFKFEGFKTKLQRIKASVQANDTEAVAAAQADLERFAQTRMDKLEAYTAAKIQAETTGKPVDVDGFFQLTAKGLDTTKPLVAHPTPSKLGSYLEQDVKAAELAIDTANNFINASTKVTEAITEVVTPTEVVQDDIVTDVPVTNTVATDDTAVDNISGETIADDVVVDEVLEPTDFRHELADSGLDVDEYAETKLDKAGNKLSPSTIKLRLGNFVRDYFISAKTNQVDQTALAEAGSVAEVDKLLRDAGIEDTVNDADVVLMTEFLPTFKNAFKGDFASKIKAQYKKVNPDYRYNTPLTSFVGKDGEVTEKLTDAMALVALNFLAYETTGLQSKTDNEIKSILGIDTSAELPVGARDLIGNSGSPETSLITSLGKDVMSAMGIKASVNTPINYAAQLEDTLGVEMLEYLASQGFIQENQVLNSDLLLVSDASSINAPIQEDDGDSSKAFTRFWGTPETGISPLHQGISDLGQESNRVSDKLVDAARAPFTASFAPITTQADTFIRSRQKISEKAKEANKIAQAIPHYVSSSNYDILDEFADEEFLEMFGYDSEVGTVLDKENPITSRNKNVVDSVRGKNIQLSRALQQLKGLRNRINNGENQLGSQPLYFGYQYTQNYRQQMQSDVSPQGDKLVRSFVNTTSKINWVRNPNRSKYHKYLKLAVAQGLAGAAKGLDPDKNGNTTVINNVDELLDNPLIADAVENLQDFLNGNAPLDKGLLGDAIKFGGEKEHSFQVLVEYARYKNFMAQPQTWTKFETSLYLELDGVTNGPFNALVQMGNGYLDDADLAYLRKGGLFVGSGDKVSFNEEREDNSELDTYNSVASIANDLLPSIMEQLQHDAAEGNFYVKQVTNHTLNFGLDAINSFLGKHVGDDGKYLRASTKNRVTVTIYGGGKTGNNNKAVSEIVNTIYSEVDSVLSRLISEPSEALFVEAQQLFSNINNASSGGGKNFETGQIDLHTADYKVPGDIEKAKKFLANFELSNDDIKTISHNYVRVHGQALGNATDMYFEKLNEVKDEMVKSSVVTWGLYNRAFLAEREKRRQALIDAGGLAPNADLTQAQLSSLQAYLIDSSPVYEMLFSETGNFSTYWSGADYNYKRVGSQEKTGLMQAKALSNRSIRSRNIGFEEIGVKVAPMLTISNDASMQMIKYLENPTGQDGNVFDAILAKIGSMETSSTAINLGAYKALRDFDQVQSVADTFNRTLANNPILSNPELTDQQKGEELIRGLVNNDAYVDKMISESSTDTEAILGMVAGSPSLRSFINQEFGVDGLQLEDALDAVNLEFADLYRVLPTIEANLNMLAQKATDRKNALLSSDLSFNQMAGLTNGGIQVEKGLPNEVLQGSQYDQANTTTADLNEYQDKEYKYSWFSPRTDSDFFRRTLNQEKPLGKIMGEIFKKNSDFIKTVKIVQGQIDPKDNVNGAYVAASNTVYIKDGLSETKKNETIAHELTHAVLADGLSRYFNDPTSLSKEELAGVKGIESVMQSIMNDPKAHEVAALKHAIGLYTSGNEYGGLQELAAYGLTNAESVKYLASQPTTGNKYVKALKDKLMHFIGQFFNLKPSLLTDLAESVYAVQGKQSSVAETQTLYSVEQNPFNAMNIFDRFKESVNPRLRGSLNDIQSQVLGKLERLPTEFQNVENGEAQVLLDSLSPEVTEAFSDLVDGGFNLDNQESLVFKLYAEVTKDSLQNNYHNAKALRSFYDSAKKQLTAADVGSQERYDALFNSTSKPEYFLANFTAMALVDEQLRSALDKVQPPRAKANDSMLDKVEFYVKQMMDKVAAKITKTSSSKPTTRIALLAKRVNHIKAKKDHVADNIEEKVNGLQSKSDDLLKTGVTKLAKAIRGSRFVTEHKDLNSFVGSIDNMIQNPELAKSGAVSFATQFSKGKKFNTGLALVNQVAGGDRFYRQTLSNKRKKVQAVDASSQSVRDRVPAAIKELFKSDLSPESATAITAILVKSDVASLVDAGFSYDEITNLVSNASDRKDAIEQITNRLETVANGTKNANWFINQAVHLGKTMATGNVYLENQMPNARVISEGLTSGLAIEDTVSVNAKPLIDALASLSALDNSNETQLGLVKDVILDEQTNVDGNAIHAVLRKQNILKQRERDAVQGDAEYAQTKGYSFDILDPNKDYRLVRQSEVKDYVKKGYAVGKSLDADKTDISSERLVPVYSKEGGNVGWLQGVLTLIDTNIGGVNPFTGKQSRSIAPSYGYSKNAVKVTVRKKKASAPITNRRLNVSEPINSMVASFAPTGDVSGYRYLVPDSVKDEHLSRNSEIHNVLGHWESRIGEEKQGAKYNGELVKALNTRYRKANIEDKANYVTISAASKDPEIQEVYRLLPDSVKKAQKELTGGYSFKVHPAEYDNLIGYRKHSITDIWKSEKGIGAAAAKMAEVTLGNQAANILRKGERGLQDLVATVKDFIIIKSIVVPAFNIMSNAFYLHLRGVKVTDMTGDVREAFQAGTDYKRLNAKLFELQQKNLQKETVATTAEIAQVEESLRTNPVYPFVEAGLMPSIVEGLEDHEDLFSYKDGLVGKAKNVVAKLPKTAKDLGKQALITQDSKTYGLLNEATELGDFVAKYALAKHLQKNEGLSQSEAMDEAAIAFIDYGELPSKKLQYLNDIGMTHFFKYFIRIQAVIVDLIIKQPSRVLMFLASGGYGLDAPSPIDANLLEADLGYKTGILDLLKGFFAHPLDALNPY